jgi:hypothetical protein
MAPGCILPSDVCVSVRSSGRVARRVSSSRDNFGGSPVSAGARARSCGAGPEGSTALFDGNTLDGGGSKSAPLSYSVVMCACAWLTGEHCRLSSFKVSYVGDNARATGSTSDGMARRIGSNACGSRRGPVSPSTLAFLSAASTSTSSTSTNHLQGVHQVLLIRACKLRARFLIGVIWLAPCRSFARECPFLVLLADPECLDIHTCTAADEKCCW